ncbi:MAG TPA: YfcE family phosphodiesterase [Syntrophorhabdaceae bacterium]|nr:YfcE family phosphodiesterase [Syntrophorhabdaceae bacterium]HPU30415.1 YfcE family phosphodiesterase [Syntrophorhabdaceae bacterium]
MLKIGVISDTHLHTVNNALKELLKNKFQDIDLLIHAGDMTTVTVYEYLKNWNLLAVRGNMDDFDLKDLLPQKRIEVINNKRIGIIHGSGSPYGIEERVMREFDEKVDIIVFGHSHVPAKKDINGVIFFNPGSFRDSKTAGIIELGEKTDFRFVTIE